MSLTIAVECLKEQELEVEGEVRVRYRDAPGLGTVTRVSLTRDSSFFVKWDDGEEDWYSYSQLIFVEGP